MYAALLACGAPPQEAPARLATILHGTFDWPALLDAADAAGLLPLLAQTLGQCPSGTAPPDVLAGLRDRAAAKTMRSLAMAGELARILRRFEAAGLTPLAFKGPTLAHLLYGNLALRDSTDLDVLVPQPQVAVALERLSAAGYHRKTRGSHPWLAGACEVTLQRDGPASEVDLHWQFSPPYFLPPDPARALERSTIVRTHGLTARTLCPEDLLLYLAIHAAREGWPLRSICDIAALVRLDALNWADALREAGLWNCRRPLAIGLHLAATLCGAALPPEARDTIRRDLAATRLAAGLASTLQRDGETPGGLRAAMLHVRTIEGARCRLRYLALRTFQPNALDADFIALPQKLAPAYYLVRPFRVAGLALGALRRG